MKILVIQLARLGDVCLTWPTVKALKRTHPGAEVHLLLRERYSEIAPLISGVDKVHVFKTAHAFQALAEDNVRDAIFYTKSFFDDLKRESFDEIINLSFSPASSYATKYIATEDSVKKGYSRFQDGFLNITDNVSSYVYAQVGENRPNRFHLADLFAGVAGVQLKFDDWVSGVGSGAPRDYTNYTVVHIGASQKKKSMPAEIWAAVIKDLLSYYSGVVYLIGASGEVRQGDEITKLVTSNRLVNLVGETTVKDLFDLISGAENYLGCDSGPMHIASLCQTRIFNISSDTVNYFETGPKSPGSRIVVGGLDGEFSPATVAEELECFIKDRTSPNKAIEVVGPIAEYSTFSNPSLPWDLIRFIYHATQAPVQVTPRIRNVLMELAELYEVGVKQIQHIQEDNNNRIAVGLMNRCEQAMHILAEKVPEVGPIVHWFMAEKSRIGPGTVDEVINETKKVYYSLGQLLLEILEANAHVGAEGLGYGNKNLDK